MLITYFRSSSYNQWDYCKMSYFLNYVLGLPQKANKRAQQGTIVHKVLEILANCKKVIQNLEENPVACDEPTPYNFNDEHIGMIKWFHDDFLKPTLLQPEEIDSINKTRINKYNYKPEAKIPYNTVHYGQDMVDNIFKRVYDCYKWDDWAPVDKITCHNWTWMALEYMNGMFDPRKKNIIEAEPHFNFMIDKPWAYYEWELPSGKKISGNLGIKGTIDLIISPSEGIIEVWDFKTGQRKNWALPDNQSRKTYNKLCTDFQLMLYYYATKKLYPDTKQIIVSIYFIRDGGPYTLCFDDRTLQETEDRLCERFQEISTCTFPAMRDIQQKDFRCNKLCDYYKMKAPNGDNMCRFIHDQLSEIGMDEVVKKYTHAGHSIGYYQEPGQNV